MGSIRPHCVAAFFWRKDPYSVVAVYEIQDNLISRVWFYV